MKTNYLARHGFVLLIIVGYMTAQAHGIEAQDLLQQQIESIQLDNQTVIDGFAKLSQLSDMAFSVELILKPNLKDSGEMNRRFTASLTKVTVRQALDWLCKLDPRYVWSRDGNAINLFPKKAMSEDSGYLLNRKIALLEFRDSSDAQEALFKAVKLLPSPTEQIAFFAGGGETHFQKPWSVRMENITLRQLLNRISLQIGPHHGWSFSCSQEFRVVSFHSRLLPFPPPRAEVSK